MLRLDHAVVAVRLGDLRVRGHHVRAAFEVPLLHEHVHVPAVLVACASFRFPQMLFEHVGHHHLPVFLRTVGDQPADAHVLDAVHAVLREHLVRQGPWAREFRMPPVAFLHGLQVPPVPRFEVLVLPDHFLRVFHRFRPFLVSWFPAADPVGKRLPRCFAGAFQRVGANESDGLLKSHCHAPVHQQH